MNLLKTPKDQILLEINPKFDKGKIGVKHGKPFRVRSTEVSSERSTKQGMGKHNWLTEIVWSAWTIGFGQPSVNGQPRENILGYFW